MTLAVSAGLFHPDLGVARRAGARRRVDVLWAMLRDLHRHAEARRFPVPLDDSKLACASAGSGPWDVFSSRSVLYEEHPAI